MSQETIHGYPIIRKSSLPDDCRYILVDRGDRPSGRYVTAWHKVGDEEWSHGNYFSDLRMAIDDLCDRAARDRRMIW